MTVYKMSKTSRDVL